jgi:hypothetical protein
MTPIVPSADATGGAVVTEQQPGAPAVPGVTRWRPRKPVVIDAIEWTGSNENEEAVRTFGFRRGGKMPLGSYLVRGITGHFFIVDAERFTATYEPALTAAESDRLRQVIDGHGNAVRAVRDLLDFTTGLSRSREGAQVVAAARDALRVLSGDEADAEPAAASTDAKEGPWTESPGVALIAVERSRQVTAEGYTPAHDARHDGSQLARAAACYALYAVGVRQLGIHPLGTAWPWPWPDADFEPGDDPVRALTKAGALIAAELDRLIAKEAGRGR